MKMNHFAASVLALLLALALCGSAMAATQVTETSFEWYNADLVKDANRLIVRVDRNSPYTLMDINGVALTDQPYIYMSETSGVLKVAVEDGTPNRYGVIDMNGKEIVPMQYGDIKVLSDRWIIVPVLEPATEENYDYSSYGTEKQFFLVKVWDVYFCGQKVGELERTSFDYGYGYGNYLVVKNEKGEYSAYDSAFNKSPYELDSSSEYDRDYKKGTFHVGTGMLAFDPSCTLTSDEVKNDVYVDGGNILDLKGNVIATIDCSYMGSFDNGYAYFKANDNYGVVDKQGNIVIEAVLDKSPYDVSFASGYELVSTGEKLAWATKEGFAYVSNVNSSLSNSKAGVFVSVKDNDGMRIVVSPLGQLPNRYQDVMYASGATTKILAVLNADGQPCVIGMAGEVVITPDEAYDSLYDLSVSNDGAYVLADRGSNKNWNHDYVVYTVAYDQTGLSIAETTWTCPFDGEVCYKNFCPECGTPRP